jgi:hypothetical protein
MGLHVTDDGELARRENYWGVGAEIRRLRGAVEPGLHILADVEVRVRDADDAADYVHALTVCDRPLPALSS